jgi:hypothetical protein
MTKLINNFIRIKKYQIGFHRIKEEDIDIGVALKKMKQRCGVETDLTVYTMKGK